MARFTNPPQREAFFAEVWALVRSIPRGRVSTYGWIAGLADVPSGMDAAAYRAFGARWVAGAMAHCPDDVPWWRVINAQGETSAHNGAEQQKTLLEAEGILFDARGRVDLTRQGFPSVG